MKLSAKHLGVLAASCLVAVSSAQVTKSGAGYLFKIKYQAGSVAAYKVDTISSFGGQTMNLAMSYTQKVLSVKNDVAKLELTMSPPMMNGQTMGSGQKAQTASMSVDTKGRTVDGMASNPGGSMNYVAKPIPIGGTWTGKTSLGAAAAQGGSVDATYKLVKISSYRGKSVAVVESTMKMTGMAGMTGTGVSYIDMSDGSLIDSKLTMSILMPAGTAGTGTNNRPTTRTK